MKKSFKYFGYIVCVILMSVCLSSCSDKDDDGNGIVGTWVDDTYPAEVLTYTFNPNGTGSGSVSSYGQVVEGWSFRYTLSGDVTKGASLIIDEYGDMEYYTVRITNDAILHLIYDDGDVIVFRRK